MSRYLVVHVGGACRAAFRVEAVSQVTRKLPLQAIAGMPSFVRGMALIRGLAVPVIDMATVMGIIGGTEGTRFVVLRAGDRNVAAAVESVTGFIDLPGTLLGKVPPLLGNASSTFVEAVSSLDEALLLILSAARLVPEDVLEKIMAEGGGD